MEQVCLLLMRLQSRNGWSASDPFGGLKVWGFGGDRRERRPKRERENERRRRERVNFSTERRGKFETRRGIVKV